MARPVWLDAPTGAGLCRGVTVALAPDIQRPVGGNAPYLFELAGVQ